MWQSARESGLRRRGVDRQTSPALGIDPEVPRAVAKSTGVGAGPVGSNPTSASFLLCNLRTVTYSLCASVSSQSL